MNSDLMFLEPYEDSSDSVVESYRGEYGGYKVVSLGFDLGHRCGYVYIPEDSPLYDRLKPFLGGGYFWDSELPEYLDAYNGVSYLDSLEIEDSNEKIIVIGYACCERWDGVDFTLARPSSLLSNFH